jgi:two-component system chemotaxis sensor kinase CheA
VIDDAEDEKADVVIASVGEELPDEAAKKTIWLRAEPEVAGKKDDSIYRYDRAGLLVALKSVGTGRTK